MTPEEKDTQIAGLRRRVAILEAHNAKMLAAIELTNQTLELCRDPNAHPAVKMIDRARAEAALREAAKPPEAA